MQIFMKKGRWEGPAQESDFPLNEHASRTDSVKLCNVHENLAATSADDGEIA